MSAIGTKRTLAIALHMSTFGGKAHMINCAAGAGSKGQKRHERDHWS